MNLNKEDYDNFANFILFTTQTLTIMRSVAPSPVWAEGERPAGVCLQEQVRVAELTAKNLDKKIHFTY